MDNQALEQRLTELENRHAYLERRFIEALRSDGLRIVELETKVQSLEGRLKDLDQVEKVAFAAYEKTHPDAQAKLQQMNETVETARGQIYFSNLPTVKDHERRSKS